MAHKDMRISDGADDNGPPNSKDHFARAADVRETEIKFLYKAPANANNTAAPNSRPPHIELLANIKNYFANRGWIKHPTDADGNIITVTTELLSRQFDVPGQEFLKQGHTLRVRGDCPDGNLYNVKAADICIKTGKSTGQSGATQRGEYENHIKDFNNPSLDAFAQKYPTGERPELDAILTALQQEEDNLVEFFRVDDLRTRYHMVIPESDHGIKGKTVVVELVTDELLFVSEFLSELLGLEDPIFLDNNDEEAEIEVEAELVLKPDEHSVLPLPNGVAPYSDDLTQAETDHVMTIIRNHILAAGMGMLRPNDFSKAERGFHRFNEKAASLKSLLPDEYSSDGQLPVSSLRNTFKAGASNDNSGATPQSSASGPLSALAQETKERKKEILRKRRVALRLEP